MSCELSPGRIIALGVCLACAAPASAWAQEDPLATPIERFVLDNGLEVLLQPDRTAPRVAVSVTYGVGLRDQPPGHHGLAHLTEHLMFQGSRNVGEDRFFMHLERIGATERNAATSPDDTSYWEVVPSSHLATVLWLESDRMASMLEHLNPETLGLQREVVLSEDREGREGSPLSRVSELMFRYVFPRSHPYHAMVERPEEIAAITMADIQWFFQRWYGPNNARLALVGDFDAATARALVERYFGTIRNSDDEPPRRRVAEPVRLEGDRRVHFATPMIMPEVRVTWPTPAYQLPGDAELDIAARVLGMGPLSRLHRRLVTETGLATSVSARQHSYELDSFFNIRIVMVPGASHDAVLAIVDEELRRMGSEPIDEAMLDWAGYHFRSQTLLSYDSLANRAVRLSGFRSPLADDGVYRLEDNLARYDRLTPASVGGAVRDLLPLDRRVVIFIIPAPDAPREGAVLFNQVVR